MSLRRRPRSEFELLHHVGAAALQLQVDDAVAIRPTQVGEHPGGAHRLDLVGGVLGGLLDAVGVAAPHRNHREVAVPVGVGRVHADDVAPVVARLLPHPELGDAVHVLALPLRGIENFSFRSKKSSP